MRHFVSLSALCLLFIVTGVTAATIPPAVRGARTVHLRVEPGPLTITVLKRDLNIYEGGDELTATLHDPFGREILTITVPDDGETSKTPGYGEPQQHTEMIEAADGGIYRLVLRGSSDLVWGLETSARHAVVEGGMLFSIGGVPGSVFFPPPSRNFKITLSALHDPGRQVVPLYDDAGDRIGEFDLSATGEQHVMEFPEEAREGLWRLDFEALDVRLEIAGVTQWSADREAWFEAGKSRWMLMPYRAARYLQPGEASEIEFSLRNSTGRPDALRGHRAG